MCSGTMVTATMTRNTATNATAGGVEHSSSESINAPTDLHTVAAFQPVDAVEPGCDWHCCTCGELNPPNLGWCTECGHVRCSSPGVAFRCARAITETPADMKYSCTTALAVRPNGRTSGFANLGCYCSVVSFEASCRNDDYDGFCTPYASKWRLINRVASAYL